MMRVKLIAILICLALCLPPVMCGLLTLMASPVEASPLQTLNLSWEDSIVQMGNIRGITLGAGDEVIQFTGTNLVVGTNPSGFRAVEALDIWTTASYSAPITVGVRYNTDYEQAHPHLPIPRPTPNAERFRLFHWNGTAWEDVTTWVDTANNIIYGEVTSLSPFFVGDPSPPESGNTPPGSGVAVSLLNGAITVTFNSVQIGGITTAFPCDGVVSERTEATLSVTYSSLGYTSGFIDLEKRTDKLRCAGYSWSGSPFWFIPSVGAADYLRYPIAVGTGWSNSAESVGYLVTTYRTIESVSDTVTVPAGTFHNCVRIGGHTEAPPEYWEGGQHPYEDSVQVWYAPGVGPVKVIIAERGGKTHTAELTSYGVSSPDPNDYFPIALGNTWSFNWQGSLQETYEITSTTVLAGFGPIPAGFRAVAPPEGTFVDILTTATYSGPVTISGRYEESWVTNENGLRLFHWNGSQWEDVTTSVDTVNNIIYGQVSSLSPFFLGEPTGTQVSTATGTGTAAFHPSSGAVQNLTAVSESLLPAEGKPNLVFPHGFFSFNITGLTPSQTVTVTITLPSAVPVGTQYWKYGPTPDNNTPHWYQLPMGDDDGDNVIIITLVDGGLGDDDLTADGVIIDQGGPGNPSGRGVPVFPSIYIGITAAFGAGILAYVIRRRMMAR